MFAFTMVQCNAIHTMDHTHEARKLNFGIMSYVANRKPGGFFKEKRRKIEFNKTRIKYAYIIRKLVPIFSCFRSSYLVFFGQEKKKSVKLRNVKSPLPKIHFLYFVIGILLQSKL